MGAASCVLVLRVKFWCRVLYSGIAFHLLVSRYVFWRRVSYFGVASRNWLSRLVFWRRVLFSGDASSVLVSRFVLWWTGVLLHIAVVVAWLARRLVRLGVSYQHFGVIARSVVVMRRMVAVILFAVERNRLE